MDRYTQSRFRRKAPVWAAAAAILALLLLQPAAEKHAPWGGDAAAAQDAGRQGESLYQS